MNDLNRRDLLKYALTTGAVLSMPFPMMLNAAQRMAERTIVSTGTKLGVVGFGSGRIFSQDKAENKRQARELIDILIGAGGNYIDATSMTVFNHLNRWLDEDVIRKLFIVNSISETGPTADEAEWLAQDKKQVLDFAQVRNAKSFMTMRKSWRLLQQLREQGKVRNIGFTFSRPSLYELAASIMKKDAADFIQVNYSLIEHDSGIRLLPMAKDNGVGVIINRPYLGGSYFKKVKGKKLPEWVKEFDCETWGQFNLKYIISHPAVTCVLTDGSKPKHARDNVGAGFGRLPNENQRRKMLQFFQTI